MSLLVLSKVYHKISVSFEMVQNFEISELAMAKFEKVIIAFAYSPDLHNEQKKKVVSSSFFYLNWSLIKELHSGSEDIKLYFVKFTMLN